MSTGMKIFIIVAVAFIILKHPEYVTQILNAITKALNG